MNQEVKQQWIAALESDEYMQGRGQLREGDTFCCLGVLCDLYKQATGFGEWEYYHDNRYIFMRSMNSLPPDVMSWANLDQIDPTIKGVELSIYNDSGRDYSDNIIKAHSFKEIAQLIRDNL